MKDNTSDLNDYMLGCDPSEPNIFAMKPETTKTLVSDADLRGETRPKGIHYMQDGEHRFNRLMNVEEVRDIYEAELTKLRSERDELVGALEDLCKYVKRAPFKTLTEADRVLAKHKPE